MEQSPLSSYAAIIILAVAILLAAVFLGPLMLSGQQSAGTSHEPLSVSYHYSAETVFEDIRANETTLSYTYFPDDTHKCETWLRQEPCYQSPDLKTTTWTLSPSEVARLRGTVRSSGFMELDATYGGAVDGQRYYSYTISVNDNGTVKTVTYQSFPGSAPEPAAFIAVRDALHSVKDDTSGLK